MLQRPTPADSGSPPVSAIARCLRANASNKAQMTPGPRPAQACLQFCLFPSPTRVLGLRPSVERGPVFFDLFQPCLVVLPRLFKCGFGCRDRPVAARAFLLPGDLFPAALAVASLLLLL